MKRYVKSSADLYKIIKVNSEYDPTLTDGRVQVTGTLEFCKDWLDDMHFDTRESSYSVVTNYDPDKYLEVYYTTVNHPATFIIVR